MGGLSGSGHTCSPAALLLVAASCCCGMELLLLLRHTRMVHCRLSQPPTLGHQHSLQHLCSRPLSPVCLPPASPACLPPPPACPQLSGAIIAPVALLFMAYALYMYKKRTYQVGGRLGGCGHCSVLFQLKAEGLMEGAVPPQGCASA